MTLEDMQERIESMITKCKGHTGEKRKNSLNELARIFHRYETRCIDLANGKEEE